MSKLKRYLSLLSLLILISGCMTAKDNYMSYYNVKNSALVENDIGGWGIGNGQKSVEYAVFSAFATGEYYGRNSPSTNWYLTMINGVSVSSSDAYEWKTKYANNKKYLTFDLKDGAQWIVADTGERYKPKIVKKQKPKKKEPKQTPDDNKVVAAASGTGFFVSKTGHIITNHHVIDQCKAVKVNFQGNEIEVKVLAVDKTNDLAILKANITPEKVYSVSNEDVTLLQDIIVAGFPLGKRVSAAIKTHKGSVSALAGFGDNYSNFQTDATINQGNSGGPVMDHKGNIVGVAVALMSAEAGQNIFFAVKSSTLKTFANSNSITFLSPNKNKMSNTELGQLITEGTVFLECWMTIAKIKQIIAQEENRKAFYSKFK